MIVQRIGPSEQFVAADANMLTPIELIKAMVGGMAARGFGRIINITSSSVKAPIDISKVSKRSTARNRLKFPLAALARLTSSAPICAFLCSTHAAYMTGQNVLADGGAYPGSF